MTRHESLTALLAKVEAGELTLDVNANAPYWTIFNYDKRWHDILSAYHGSLDSAKALHEAVLTGFFWQRQGFVMIVTNDHTGWGNGIYWRGRDDHNPARAWLIAILKALIAMEEDHA